MYDFRISEYYNQFGIYQRSHVSRLEPLQNNLNNPEAYSEPCQTSEMEFFCENSQWLKAVNFFVKHSILDVWQSSEYPSVIW